MKSALKGKSWGIEKYSSVFAYGYVSLFMFCLPQQLEELFYLTNFF